MNLRQRAIEAYRKQDRHDANKVKRQFQKTFAVEPDYVEPCLDSDVAIIGVNDLLIRSWLTANKRRWYELVTQCIECKTIFSCSSGIGRSDFENLVGLGKALEALGQDYKTEMMCDNCMRAYRE